jgi:hypothetical protein
MIRNRCLYILVYRCFAFGWSVGFSTLSTRALHWVPIPMPMGFGWAWVHGCDVIVHGWASMQYYCSHVGIGFVHPYIQLQIGVKLLGCREHANQEALRAKAAYNERPLICPI